MTKMAGNLVKADAHTAFILGNGPSLRVVSLPSLSPFATVGLNAAYRYWREINWRPTHYACLDLTVGLSHKDAIAELIREGRIEKFLLRGNLVTALGDVARDRRVVNFDALRSRIEFLQEPAVTTGSHSALWAGSLGYEKIILLGVDGRYKEIVDGAERREGIELEVVRAGENPNYFFEGYQQPGDRYNLPNPRPGLHVEAWRATGILLKNAGIEVYNANADSAVRCFPFVDLDALLGSGAAPVPADEALSEQQAQRRALPAPAAGGNAVKKLTHFIRANPATCVAPGVALALGLAGLVLSVPAVPGVIIAAFALASALIWTLFVLLFYTRRVTADQLNRMRREIDGLQAQLADEKRLPAAKGARFQ